jgi:hypothetical protein
MGAGQGAPPWLLLRELKMALRPAGAMRLPARAAKRTKSMFASDQKLFRHNQVQYWAVGIMSAAVMFATFILVTFGRPVFGRFIGSVNPLFAALCVSLTLAAITPFALKMGVFEIYSTKTMTGVLLSACVASFFGLVVIVADTKIVFPHEMNILFPESLLFYPVIGYCVEILFHVLPVFVIFFFSITRVNRHVLWWVAVVAVAAIEPSFQTLTGFAEGYAIWVGVFVFVQVFAINVCQLVIFRRYDFISMYAFRLVYYLFWHIGWGYFRLQVLF